MPLINLVARLSCGHDLTIRGIRDDCVPVAAYCLQCEGNHSIDNYVDNRPVKISPKQGS